MYDFALYDISNINIILEYTARRIQPHYQIINIQ